VYETALSAGARRVFLIEEPVAASLGAGLPIDDPAGSMVVDIGGGTTDIAVLSLGDVVLARSVRCAGNAMDEAIVRHVRRHHQLLIGESNAEHIKIAAGTASHLESGRHAEIHIRGRDLRLGRAKSIVLGPQDIADALEPTIDELAEFIMRALEDLPPEISTDICERGIFLTGGGSMLRNLDAELERRLGVSFVVPERPTHCVINGTASILRDFGTREHLLIKP
jgi:rod shape-determining protein MreB